MRPGHPLTIAAALALFAAWAFLVGACGGDETEGPSSALFEPERAAQLARDALLQPSDLPGSGWQVGEAGRPDVPQPATISAYEALLREEPVCSRIAGILNVDRPHDGTGPPAGSAGVEYVRLTQGALLPEQLQMKVLIGSTVAEAQGRWAEGQAFIESPETRNCFAKFLRRFWAGLPNITVKSIDSVPSSAASPQLGASMSYRFAFTVSGADVSGTMEMYFWSYANASVSLTFLIPGDPSPQPIRTTLSAADRRVARVAAD